MNKTNFDKANILKLQIEQLNGFLKKTTTNDAYFSADKNYCSGLIQIKKEEIKTYKLIGKEWKYRHCYSEEIDLPLAMLEEFRAIVKNKLIVLENEFDDLIK